MARNYKPAPHVDRTCLVCSEEFQGSTAATRCTPCRTSGHKVQAAKQSTRRKPPVVRLDLPQHDKSCTACGAEFTTHKAKAARCNECITSGNTAPKRTCLECRKAFPLIDDTHVNCRSCASMLDIPQFEMTPEQQAKQLEADTLSKHQEALAHQTVWLDAREAKPKGYLKMSERTAKTTLGVLWLQLCAADGAASSIMYAAEPRGLTEEDKVTLLTRFYILRTRGYHPSACANLCPKAILKKATQEALRELPQVDDKHCDRIDGPQLNNATPSLQDWGRIASAVNLGLPVNTTTESQTL